MRWEPSPGCGPAVTTACSPSRSTARQPDARPRLARSGAGARRCPRPARDARVGRGDGRPERVRAPRLVRPRGRRAALALAARRGRVRARARDGARLADGGRRPPPGRLPTGRSGSSSTPLCTWRSVHGERFGNGDPQVEATDDGFVFEGAYRVAGAGFAGRRRVVSRRPRPRGGGARPERPRGPLGRRNVQGRARAGRVPRGERLGGAASPASCAAPPRSSPAPGHAPRP